MLGLTETVSWYVFLAVVVYALQRMTRCFTTLNVYTLFAGFLLLRHGLTVPFDNEVNEWFAGITLSPSTRPRFYTALVLMYISLVAGIYASRILIGPGVRERHFQLAMRRTSLPAGVNPLFFGAVVTAAVVLVVKFQLMASSFSLGDILTGKLTALAYEASRIQVGQATHYSVGPWQRLASITYYGLFPLLTYTLYFLQRSRPIWRPVFIGVLLVGLANGLETGQKSPALFLLLGLAVSWYLARGRRHIRTGDWRAWLAILVAGFVVFPYLYRVQYPEFTYERAVRATWYRLSSEYDRGLQLYFEIYPDVHGFMYGKSSGLLNSVRGLSLPVDELPERYIAVYYLGPGYLNTWNAAFVGTAWADFGYVGVVAETLLLAAVLQFFARWFSRVRKTALVMGTECALILAATKTSEVSLTASFLSFGLISAFILYLTLRRDAGRFLMPQGATIGRLASHAVEDPLQATEILTP